MCITKKEEMKDEKRFCLVKKSEVKLKKQHSPYYFEDGLLLMDAMTKLKVKKE